MKDYTAIYAQRREKVRQKMHQYGLDALFISHAANRFYLCGFELHDPQCNESAGYLLLTASGHDYICTDPRYFDTAKRIWDENHIFIYSSDKINQLRKLFKDKVNGLIGIEACSLSHNFAQKLSRGMTVLNTNGLVENLRVIKDKNEIELLQKSCALNHKLMDFIPSVFAEGISEKDLSWQIEKFFRENGASELAFSNIVAFGNNAALPHATPSHRKLLLDSPILIDVGARLDNYCSDQTRTYWFGDNMSEQFKLTLELVQKAQSAAIAKIKAGMTMREIYEIAWNYFESKNVSSHFTHGLGHGIGLEVHEAPSLSAKSSAKLQAGMIVTVEPGLYYAEWGGVRWEYMVLVEEDGAVIL